MAEEPICNVTIVAKRGANSREQMDEMSLKVMTYANGKIIQGYAVVKSFEGIDHVRVSEVGKRSEWIRCWEKDGTNPLVKIDYLKPQTTTPVQQEGYSELVSAIRDQTAAIKALTVAVLAKK